MLGTVLVVGGLFGHAPILRDFGRGWHGDVRCQRSGQSYVAIAFHGRGHWRMWDTRLACAYRLADLI